MPEPVFEEIKAHIIQEPFLRERVHVTLELNWTNVTEREYLYKKMFCSCDVKNIFRTKAKYEMITYEERYSEDHFPGFTKISEVTILDEETKKTVVYKDEALNNVTQKTDYSVQVIIPIDLESGQKIKVTAYTESVLSNRDIYNYSIVKPAINLKMTVIHPKDLKIQESFNHSSKRACVCESNTKTLKIWRIDAGLLPFQGITLSWFPSSDQGESESGEAKLDGIHQ